MNIFRDLECTFNSHPGRVKAVMKKTAFFVPGICSHLLQPLSYLTHQYFSRYRHQRIAEYFGHSLPDFLLRVNLVLLAEFLHQVLHFP